MLGRAYGRGPKHQKHPRAALSHGGTIPRNNVWLAPALRREPHRPWVPGCHNVTILSHGTRRAALSHLRHHDRWPRHRTPTVVECADDQEAIGKAAQFTNGKAIELWEGALYRAVPERRMLVATP